MKTRAQRVAFRAILAVFTIVWLFLAVGIGFDIAALLGFFVVLGSSVLSGLIIGGLVIWVMKGFSDDLPQEDDDDDNPPPPRAYASSRANPPQKNTKTAMKMLVCLFLISMMIVFSQ